MTRSTQQVIAETQREINDLREILTCRLGSIDDEAEYSIYARLLEAGWTPPGGADETAPEGSRDD